MSSDGMKSIHLFDEKSSKHFFFYNPGRRHTERSDPVWDPPQMSCSRHVCILSLLVNEFAGEESSWQTQCRVPQHGEVKPIQKGVYARPLLHDSTSQQRTIISTPARFPLTFSPSDMTE